MTPIAVPERFSLAHLCCDRHPDDAPAVIEDGGETISYGELARTLVTGDRISLAAVPSRSWTFATYSHAATEA